MIMVPATEEDKNPEIRVNNKNYRFIEARSGGIKEGTALHKL